MGLLSQLLFYAGTALDVALLIAIVHTGFTAVAPARRLAGLVLAAGAGLRAATTVLSRLVLALALSRLDREVGMVLLQALYILGAGVFWTSVATAAALLVRPATSTATPLSLLGSVGAGLVDLPRADPRATAMLGAAAVIELLRLLLWRVVALLAGMLGAAGVGVVSLGLSVASAGLVIAAMRRLSRAAH